jgi:hypothetical protein
MQLTRRLNGRFGGLSGAANSSSVALIVGGKLSVFSFRHWGVVMGVLTDFVVVDRLDAQRVCDSMCPSRDFAGMDAKGIDTVKLGTLHSVLTGDKFNPSFISETVCSGGDEGPWVFEVPPDLVHRVAKLDAPQVALVGKKWAATEEFSSKYSNWPVEAVQQMLQELVTLCNRAVDEGKAVLMWMCL